MIRRVIECAIVVLIVGVILIRASNKATAGSATAKLFGRA